MKLLRFVDLVAMGVFTNRMSLKRAIDNQNFPEGFLVTPNARAWREDEVLEWLATRPTGRKAVAVKAGEVA
ncbi:helix-turn-helix transcriptional regulator [Methylocystis rosea]|uniref:AlpA family phage regulatory protein n=1 Tax=Methylocystis rosea TaxID=173366 RepID=A0A3G8M321_9HYPH|nr:hypothetical protein [Methylocystis rosea]AZG76326.1 hypothetical protein EHO51_06060 [Methylocystis rosea]